MNNQPTQPQQKIDLSTTTAVRNEDGEIVILAEGTLLRKQSRFVAGTDKDNIIPIPIMYCVKSLKVLLDNIPTDIRDEYKDIGFSLG